MSECTHNCSACVNSPFYPKYGRFEYSEEYKHPFAAIMSVTDDCTNACPYCFVRFGKHRMTLETAKAACKYIISGAEYHNQRPSMTFFGGEPLLELDTIIKPIVEEFPEMNFSITTNGYLLTPEVVDYLHAHNVGILFSFDGVKEVQDNGRPLKNGKSSFDEISKNIPYLIERYGPTVTMRSTLTKASIPHLYETFKFANNVGFVEWAFAIDCYEEYDENDKEKLIEQLDLICHDISIAIHKGEQIARCRTISAFFNSLLKNEESPSFEIDNTLFRCGMGTTGTGISYDGLIIPCQEKNSKPEYAIGDVWNGIDEEKHKAYLEKYMTSMQNYNCNKPCKDGVKAICLNDICPSRHEDLGFNHPSSGLCILHQAMNKTVSRLYLKYAHSPNPWAEFYFKSFKDMEDNIHD